MNDEIFNRFEGQLREKIKEEQEMLYGKIASVPKNAAASSPRKA